MLFAMLMVTDSVSVTITGDILLDRGVRKVIEQKGTDAVFSPFVDSVFQSSDIVIGNLECPATKIKEPSFKQFIFRAEPEWLFTLKQHGITHLNLANNHSVDQGRAGLVDTRENVVSAGMIPIGAGRTMEEAARPVLLTSSPGRFTYWLLCNWHWRILPICPKSPLSVKRILTRWWSVSDTFGRLSPTAISSSPCTGEVSIRCNPSLSSG